MTHQQATIVSGKTAHLFNVAVLRTAAATLRVREGTIGMTFPVEKIIMRNDGTYFMHVRDYRYPSTGKGGYQHWTLDGKDAVLI